MDYIKDQKIAVILTGQIRTWKLALPILKKTLLEKYNCDVFLGIDLDNTLQNENDNPNTQTKMEDALQVVEFIKPKKHIIYNNNIDIAPMKYAYRKSGYVYNVYSKNTDIAKQTEITNANNIPINLVNFADFKMQENKLIFNKLYDPTKPIQEHIDMGLNVEQSWVRRYRQYTVVSKCLTLMKDYAEENKIEYATVIRVRFDQLLHTMKHRHKEFKEYCFQENGFLKYCPENITKAATIKDCIKIDIPRALEKDIFVFGGGIFDQGNHLHMYVNDQFFITSYKSALLFMDFNKYICDNMKKMKDTYLPFYAAMEYMFANYLFDNQFNIYKLENISGYFIREFISKSN